MNFSFGLALVNKASRKFLSKYLTEKVAKIGEAFTNLTPRGISSYEAVPCFG
jgi:hypothetical protein